MQRPRGTSSSTVRTTHRSLDENNTSCPSARTHSLSTAFVTVLTYLPTFTYLHIPTYLLTYCTYILHIYTAQHQPTNHHPPLDSRKPDPSATPTRHGAMVILIRASKTRYSTAYMCLFKSPMTKLPMPCLLQEAVAHFVAVPARGRHPPIPRREPQRQERSSGVGLVVVVVEGGVFFFLVRGMSAPPQLPRKAPAVLGPGSGGCGEEVPMMRYCTAVLCT